MIERYLKNELIAAKMRQLEYQRKLEINKKRIDQLNLKIKSINQIREF